MKILKWVLIVLVILVLVILGFLVYMGAFSSPGVTEQKIGPYTLVYEDYTGPYSGSGRVIGQVFNSLKSDGIVTQKAFGIYLNDPKTTPPDKLQSELGCVLEEKDLGKVPELRKKYKIMTWKKVDCLVVEFPLRNILSYMIGPMKAYPKLAKAFREKNYKMGSCMELYNMPAKKIFFIFEIAK